MRLLLVIRRMITQWVRLHAGVVEAEIALDFAGAADREENSGADHFAEAQMRRWRTQTLAKKTA
jgi:hypothetical protein